MRCLIIGLSAVTGAAGGAIAGAVLGGPVGAAAGAVIGGTASGPGPVVVAPGPVAAPCDTRTSTTTNNNTGASVTRQRRIARIDARLEILKFAASEGGPAVFAGVERLW